MTVSFKQVDEYGIKTKPTDSFLAEKMKKCGLFEFNDNICEDICYGLTKIVYE